MKMPASISIDRYVPNPEKPGYLKHVGRLTPQRLSEKIWAAMRCTGLDSRFEWAGLPPTLKYGHCPQKLGEELPTAEVTATWHPGSNEGYLLMLFTHIDGERICLWHAKMFSIAEAIAGHLLLVHLFFPEGSFTEQFLQREIARLLEIGA